jgi:CRISPR-associated protein Cas5d
MKNTISFKVWGRYALFTDPITRVGGEKCSYHIPTYEALKGIAKSIYWKPTFIWVIDKVRIMNRIKTQTKGMKPLKFSEGGNDLSIYTFLSNVEYQVQAHFEWNTSQLGLISDRIDGKHFAIAKRCLELGGRQDIFLGTRDCQGYVEPCEFGDGKSYYDDSDEIAYGLMFHGFNYPEETGESKLECRMHQPTMVNGVINFPRPNECKVYRFVKNMIPKKFGTGTNVQPVESIFSEMRML